MNRAPRHIDYEGSTFVVPKKIGVGAHMVKREGKLYWLMISPTDSGEHLSMRPLHSSELVSYHFDQTCTDTAMHFEELVLRKLKED